MENNKKIKVLIIDDSIVFRKMISRYLQEHKDLEIIGTAKDSYDARDKIIQLKPDVLTLDIEMPGIDGIEFLKILMDQHPLPTIVISGADGRCFDAISAGAVGFVEKPTSATMNQFSNELAQKIREASIAKLEKNNYSVSQSKILRNAKVEKNTNTIIAIGASMGGVEAVKSILKQLPLGLPGIVVTQHMPPVFTKRYAEQVNKECEINVVEGKDGQEILSGYAYIAPGSLQMGIVKKNNKYYLDIAKGEKVSGHCPSVDYLFESVSKVAKENAIGIVLTGMGSDGAKGLLQIRTNGGYTIGQNKNSCVVYGMPMMAKNLGAVIKETSLEMIPNVILNQIKIKGSRANL